MSEGKKVIQRFDLIKDRSKKTHTVIALRKVQVQVSDQSYRDAEPGDLICSSDIEFLKTLIRCGAAVPEGIAYAEGGIIE